MQTYFAKFKLKGSIEDAQEWAQYLNAHKDEVLETLEAEGVIFELAVIDQQADGPYLIYVMKADDLKKAFEVFAVSEKSVDLYHKKIIVKICGKPEYLIPIIDFTNSKRL